ncbi:MAG: triose-phosphate isomerase [Candidatus Altiarchaeota archaeon]
MRPIVVINFKTYKESTGELGLKLAKICDDTAKEYKLDIFIAPQVSDIYRISKNVKIPVFAQHIDAISYGSNTGHVLAEAIKEAGASGSLINHSEKRLTLADIEFCVRKLKELSMSSIVCSNNIETTKAIAALEPDFVAIEPPELIGSGIPVSKAQPDIVSNAVDAAREVSKKVKILCGAGISTWEDLKAAIDLGTDGVLLASGIVKAKDQKNALLNLIGPLKN